MDLLACLGKAALLLFPINRFGGIPVAFSERVPNGFCSSTFHFGIDMLMF